MRSDRALRGTAAALIDWERAFEKALAAGDPLAASDILRRTGQRGWVKKAELVRAAAIVRDQAASSFVRRDWASRLRRGSAAERKRSGGLSSLKEDQPRYPHFGQPGFVSVVPPRLGFA